MKWRGVLLSYQYQGKSGGALLNILTELWVS